LAGYILMYDGGWLTSKKFFKRAFPRIFGSLPFQIPLLTKMPVV